MGKKRKYEMVEGDVCGNCAHFHQHYVLWGAPNRFSALSCGHCGHPRIKTRETGESCPRFKPRTIPPWALP